MVYRLYVETVKPNDKVAWAFTFYNHQDFLVYKRAGISTFGPEAAVIIHQSIEALIYFERSMHRCYYDEHFSTRIDEAYVTLYTLFLTLQWSQILLKWSYRRKIYKRSKETCYNTILILK